MKIRSLIWGRSKRYTWIVEIIIFFLLLSFIEYQLTGEVAGWRSRHLYNIPHPFWIGIGLFGLVYGVGPGFLVGLVSAVFISFGVPAELGWNPMDWGARLVFPFCFVIGGIFAGMTRFVFFERITELTGEVRTLKMHIDELDTLNTQLISTNLKLEKKVVSRFDTFHTLFGIFQKLSNLDLEQIYQAIPEIIGKVFASSKCALYLIDPEGRLVLTSDGWEEDPESVIPASHPFAKKLRSISRTVTFHPVELKIYALGDHLAIGLADPTGRPLGVVRVQVSSLIEINPSNLKLLSLLAGWIAESITNSLEFEERKKLTTVDKATGLSGEKHFWSNVQKTLTSAIRNKYDVVLLMYEFDFDIHQTQLDEKPAVEVFADVFKDQFRGDDELAIADYGGSYHFLVMMPFISLEQAEIPFERTSKALSAVQGGKNNFRRKQLSLMDGSLFLDQEVNEKINLI